MSESDVAARGLFLPFIVVSLGFGAASSAQAACSTVGTSVSCSGAADPLSPNYSNSSTGLQVNVNPGATVGVFLGAGGTAMQLTGNNNTLINNGRIDPTTLGPISITSRGLFMGNTAGSIQTITNYGTIAGASSGGIDSQSLAVTILNGNGGTTNFTNSGTISALNTQGSTSTPADNIAVVSFGGAQTNFDNSGTITGRVGLGVSTVGNTFTNSGTINGSVHLGDFSTNTFIAKTGSSVNAAGGTAGSVAVGYAGNNVSYAEAGTVDGGLAGNDTLKLQQGISANGSLNTSQYINFDHLAVESGTWTLSGVSTVSDATLEGGSTTILNNGSALGTGTVTANNGTIEAGASTITLNNDIIIQSGGLGVSGPNNLTLDGDISANGALTKTGSGELTLSGTNTYSGVTNLHEGTLTISGSGTLGYGILNVLGDAELKLNVATGPSFIDLSDGTSLTINNAVDSNIFGSVYGNGSLIKAGTGTLYIVGAVTRSGDTTINAGTLAISGQWQSSGTVTLANTGTEFNITNAVGNQTIGALSGVAGTSVDLGSNFLTFGDATSQTFAGTIGGTGGITKQGTGTQTLTGTNTYSGGTTLRGGTLALSNSAAIGTGSLTVDDASTLDLGNSVAIANNIVISSATLTVSSVAASSINGVIAGNGSLSKSGAGTLALSGANIYTGGTTINAGVLTLGAGGSLASTGAVNLSNAGTGFDISGSGINQTIGGLSGVAGTTVSLGAHTLTFGDATNNTFNGVFSGTGNIIKQGSGTQILGGASLFSGTTTVAAGTLELAGASSSGDTTVKSGATLSGTGAVGSLLVESGGRLSLGNATVATAGLNVYRNLTLAAGSTYAFDFSGNGDSDGISVGGIAYLRGGLSITALDAETSYQNGQVYTLVTAAGGVDGTFNPITNNSAFLNYDVLYDLNGAQLQISLAGNANSLFSDKANTPNQINVARALDTLEQSGSSLALYNDLLQFSGDDARAAFDELGGVSFASGQSGMINSANTLNNVINNRMRGTSGGVGATPVTTAPLGYAEEKRPARGTDPFATYSTAGKTADFDDGRFAVWGAGLGSWGKVDGSLGAPDTDTKTAGLLFGADGMLGDQWHAGVFGGYSYSSFDSGADDQRSRNYHAGIYGDSQWGNIALRTGLNYTYHDVDTTRVLSTLGQRLSGDYSAHTVSAFGELAYRMDLGSSVLEPFAGLSHTWNRTGGFTETGGTAALSVDGRSMNSTATTLGLRASSEFDLDGTLVTARGTIGWVHAFGDVSPVSTARFASGDAFSVTGTPIDRNAALVELGLDFALTANATLGVGYNGQIGANAYDHAFNAGLKVKF